REAHVVHGVHASARSTEHSPAHGVMLGEVPDLQQRWRRCSRLVVIGPNHAAAFPAASATSRSDSQHAAQCPRAFSSSGGYSTWQRGVAYAQRGANAQPTIGSDSDGTVPAISASRPPAVPSLALLAAPSFGMESSRPRVEGWRGRANREMAEACSTLD